MAAIDRGEDVIDDLAADQQVHPVLARLEMSGSLSSRVRTGIAWTGIFRLVMQLINTGSQVVLARLLLPTDYGLVALTGVVVSFAGMLTQLGLAAAVVQSRRVTERLLSTAFWLNVISGIAVTGAVIAVAPLIADFYGDERVTDLLRVSALTFTVSCAAVHSALLQRSLQFKKLGSLEVLGAAIGLGATIVLAWRGFGAYSLVLGPLLQTTLMTGVFWWRVRWLPRTFMHRRELGELWRFGGGLTGSNILNFCSRNADTVLLGRFVGAGDLGLYSRSYSLMMAPLSQVTGVITRVLLPAFAEMQHDLPRLRRAWLATVRASFAVGLPVSLGVAVSAPAFVETLYGARWLGMATVLTLLSASVPPQLIGRNLGPVYQAMGRTGLQFRISIWTTLGTVGAIVAGLPWGITGVALALAIKSWVAFPVPLVPMMRMIGLRAGEMWAALRPLVLAGAVMVVLALGARLACEGLPSWIVLSAQTLSGGVGYLGSLRLLDPESFKSVLARLRPRRRA